MDWVSFSKLFVPQVFRRFDADQSGRFEAGEITEEFVLEAKKAPAPVLRNLFTFAEDAADQKLAKLLAGDGGTVPDFSQGLLPGEYSVSKMLWDSVRAVLSIREPVKIEANALSFRNPLDETELRLLKVFFLYQGVTEAEADRALQKLGDAKILFNAHPILDPAKGENPPPHQWVVMEGITHERAHLSFNRLTPEKQEELVQFFRREIRAASGIDNSKGGAYLNPFNPFRRIYETLGKMVGKIVIEDQEEMIAGGHAVVYAAGWAAGQPSFAKLWEDPSVGKEAKDIFQNFLEQVVVADPDKILEWGDRLLDVHPLEARNAFVSFAKKGCVAMDHEDEKLNVSNGKFLERIVHLLLNAAAAPALKRAVLSYIVYVGNGPLYVASLRHILWEKIPDPETRQLLLQTWQEVEKEYGSEQSAGILESAKKAIGSKILQ